MFKNEAVDRTVPLAVAYRKTATVVDEALMVSAKEKVIFNRSSGCTFFTIKIICL